MNNKFEHEETIKAQAGYRFCTLLHTKIVSGARIIKLHVYTVFVRLKGYYFTYPFSGRADRFTTDSTLYGLYYVLVTRGVYVVSNVHPFRRNP
mgnify:CR=1 FL=1